MALKTIETKAIISAQDQTGATFAEVAQKLRNMEGVAKRASETAGRVGVSVGSSMGGISTRVQAATRSINAMGLAIAGLTVIGVEKLAKLAESVIDVGAEFDKLARRQQAVLNISEQEQKPLLKQATILGGTTPFKKLQVIEAQTELAKRGIPVQAIAPITAAAAQYAQAQGVGLPEATKLLATALFAEGKRDASAKEIARVADRLVKASQISGMTAEEMEAAQRGGTAEAAGVSQPFLMAQVGAMHLANIPDPGAAAVRFASMLSKPTPEALNTLEAMGIHFKDFAKAGTQMRAGDLSSEFERQMGGRKLSATGLAQVQAVLSNPAIAGGQEKLTKALNNILGAGLAKGDAKKVSKIIEKFWSESLDGVDVEGLERALIKRGISGSQAVGIFGKRGGLAFKALSEHALDVSKFEKQIKEAPEGLAAREAEKQMGGLSGAKLRFEGGWQNLLTTLATDNEKWMTPLYDMGARLESAFVNTSGNVRKLGEAAAAAATSFVILGGAIGAAKFIDALVPGSTIFGSAAKGLGGLKNMLFGAPMALAGAGLLASTSAANAGEDEQARRLKYRGGFVPGLQTFGPPTDKLSPWFPGNPHITELKGAANIGVRVDVGFDPGLIAKTVSQTINAGGNLRADTGVSMPR
jgi:hypothetical protein